MVVRNVPFMQCLHAPGSLFCFFLFRESTRYLNSNINPILSTSYYSNYYPCNLLTPKLKLPRVALTCISHISLFDGVFLNEICVSQIAGSMLYPSALLGGNFSRYLTLFPVTFTYSSKTARAFLRAHMSHESGKHLPSTELLCCSTPDSSLPLHSTQCQRQYLDPLKKMVESLTISSLVSFLQLYKINKLRSSAIFVTISNMVNSCS